jgi:hypothetical protein
MSPGVTDVGLHYFYHGLGGEDQAEDWNAAAVLDYVLGWYVNGKGVGGGYPGPKFYLIGRRDILGMIVRTWDLEGKNALACLNAIVSKSRGLGARLLTDGVGPVYVEVFSLFAADNAAVWILDMGSRRLKPEITFEGSHTFDIISVRGKKPVRICCTFAVSDGNYAPLPAMWSGELETEYLAIGGPGNTAKISDAKRQVKRYKGVFQRFGVAGNWDWQCGVFNCAPAMNMNGELDFTGTSAQYSGSRKFDREIPYYETEVDDAEAQQRTAFVLVRVQEGEGFVWYYVDKLLTRKLHGAHVTPSSSDMSVLVESAINHIAAKDIFTKTDTAALPEYSYLQYYLTAQFPIDVYPAVERLVQVMGRRPEVPRVKVIEDAEAEIIVVAPGTIYDVSPSNPANALTETAMRYFRNDVPKLRAIADLAANWYSQQKAVINWVGQGIVLDPAPGIVVGGAVDGAGFTEVGTAVTNREWDLVRNTTTIKTGFTEWDASDTDRLKGTETEVKETVKKHHFDFEGEHFARQETHHFDFESERFAPKETHHFDFHPRGG